MVHGNFAALESGSFHQNRHEAVQAIEAEQRFHTFTLEHTDGATGVFEFGFQHPTTKVPRHARGDLSDKRVLAFVPPTAGEIAILQLLHEIGKICRIILKIAIKRRDERPVRSLNAGPNGSALPAVLVQTKSAHVRILFPCFRDALPSLVIAVIVNEHQFPITAGGIERRRRLIRHGLDVVFLIEDRNDDGDRVGHA